jgi:hypothetical protein
VDNLEKIKFVNTTYLCNATPSSNFYNKSNLLVGTINTKNKNVRLYKSLLRVYKSNSKLRSNKNIYLFLFVDDMYVNTGSQMDFSIFGNDEELNTSNVNWSTFSKNSNSVHVDISVSSQSIGKYIKINITPLIKSSTSYTSTYNLIIEAAHSNSTNIIQFSSSNGENIPYLTVENNTIDSSVNKTKSNKLKVKNHDMDNNLENHKKNASMNEFYTKIIDQMNNQSLKLDSLEKSLTGIFSSLETNITNIKNDELNNIVSDLNELTKSEILQLKNSVNYDIIQLKNSIESKITNKKNNESDLNDKIASTLSQINQNFSDVNDTITSLKDHIEILKNEGTSINESLLINALNNLTLDLNELTKNEILQLKNSVNNDMVELKNTINNDVSNLKNSINNFNDNLLELSNRLSKLTSIMGNILVEPIDN